MVAIHWNEAPLVRALTSRPMMDAAERIADRVAERARSANVRVEGVPGDVELPVVVKMEERDGEPYASIIVAHPSGLAVQAKHGLLTRAASDLGYEVTQYYTTKAGVRRLATQAQVDNWTRG